MDWPTFVGSILGSNLVTVLVTAVVTRRGQKDTSDHAKVATVIETLQELADSQVTQTTLERERAERERRKRRAWERFGESVIKGARDGSMPPWPEYPTGGDDHGAGTGSGTN